MRIRVFLFPLLLEITGKPFTRLWFRGGGWGGGGGLTVHRTRIEPQCVRNERNSTIPGVYIGEYIHAC